MLKIGYLGEINDYLKCEVFLESNIQKLYLLIIRQCTYLMRKRLKASSKLTSISSGKDVPLLIDDIRSIVFKFEEQWYPIMAIHNQKSMFYSFRQMSLTNADYLQNFRNLDDIKISLSDNLYDRDVEKIVIQNIHGPTITDIDYPNLTPVQNNNIVQVSSENYLEYELIEHSDKNIWKIPRVFRE